MTTVAELIAEVENGPEGPQVGAFFDLDGTLVKGYTASALYADRVRRRDIGAGEVVRTLAAGLDATLLGGDSARLGDIGVGGLKGRSEDELVELGERLFVQRIAGTVRPEARDIVRAHLRMGHTVAISSSATRYQIEPLAHNLGVENVLCTRLGVDGGILTGEIDGTMLWGEPKARAVRRFARERGIDLALSHGYANGQEDIPFLGSVGRPFAVNPHPLLREAAGRNGWSVLTLREPRRPGPRAYLGTAGMLAGINVGLGVGAAVGLLSRDRRHGINTGIALGTELGLALAGVRIAVIGEHNLWRSRPAIFIGNHQSELDAVVLGALVRRDFTAVGKKEARHDPRVLFLSAALDPAWVDRGNTAQAVAALDKVVERIRGGLSLVIFPEGTRTPTPVLGRFKKGAFHMAMQARVPIVPVVLRNAGELMRKGSRAVNPGTVEVCVLDPIPTERWTVDRIDEHVAEVRQRFVDTLERWPA